MRELGISNVKAALSAIPLILLAAIVFAFADAIVPVAGFLAPVAALLGLIVFFYLSGTRRN